MTENRLIASCGQELKIHEWSSGKTIYSLSPSNGPNNFFRNISWSISGKQLLAIPFSCKPVIVKRTSEPKVIDFKLETFDDVQLADVGIFSKNTDQFVTFGSLNGEVYVYDVHSNDIIRKFPNLPSPVTLMDYTLKDTFLAAGCKNGQIFLYNAKGNICSSFIVPWSQSLSSMLFHPSRELYLAAASKEGVVAIWDVETSTAKFVAKNHNKPITDMAILATEELLATVGLDRKAYIYDLRTKEVVFNKIFSSELSAVACSMIGEEFAIGTTRGRIFFIDKRKPDYTKGSIAAQKGSIRGICFCNDLTQEKNAKLEESMSDPILIDDAYSEAQMSNIESDVKSQTSGEFTVRDYRPVLSRIPGGMDDGLDAIDEQWIEQLTESIGDKKIPLLQVVNENTLKSIKQEIIGSNVDVIQALIEEINAQFLKIRMGVSREFCRLEQSNNKRWQDFNATLLKLAGCDEPGSPATENALSEITNESQHTNESKPESLYSPIKTKVTNYESEN